MKAIHDNRTAINERKTDILAWGHDMIMDLLNWMQDQIDHLGDKYKATKDAYDNLCQSISPDPRGRKLGDALDEFALCFSSTASHPIPTKVQQPIWEEVAAGVADVFCTSLTRAARPSVESAGGGNEPPRGDNRGAIEAPPLFDAPSPPLAAAAAAAGGGGAAAGSIEAQEDDSTSALPRFCPPSQANAPPDGALEDDEDPSNKVFVEECRQRDFAAEKGITRARRGSATGQLQPPQFLPPGPPAGPAAADEEMAVQQGGGASGAVCAPDGGEHDTIEHDRKRKSASDEDILVELLGLSGLMVSLRAHSSSGPPHEQLVFEGIQHHLSTIMKAIHDNRTAINERKTDILAWGGTEMTDLLDRMKPKIATLDDKFQATKDACGKLYGIVTGVEKRVGLGDALAGSAECFSSTASPRIPTETRRSIWRVVSAGVTELLCTAPVQFGPNVSGPARQSQPSQYSSVRNTTDISFSDDRLTERGGGAFKIPRTTERDHRASMPSADESSREELSPDDSNGDTDSARTVIRITPTALCKYWTLRHRCPHGDDCSFAHGEDELRPLTRLIKVRLCPSFMETGECSMGRRCWFAHGEQELQDRTKKIDRLCKFHREGFCNQGSRCRFIHDSVGRLKTSRQPPTVFDFIEEAYKREASSRRQSSS
ncbi:unnamed protein product [Vitrella brassicaformis CCMP3155]|uniref:C3H1-type domain-containing protein n=1 Tax=Vitrella brassicaformis (strain CCMP3155) TaxID=1169540 RepID=A0A0G4FQG5_VITBC|nr:unnamed protein product [Vitrella brassicaformis CCMP3155]|eukprot:CEM16678.1 unnamed protein product [Vitrella brassicaformis CCMP3155]